MEPIAGKKRLVAAYVAYRRRGEEYEFYLQKRDANAPRGAGMFGVFGGGVDEGESIEAGLYREVAEELRYRPVAIRYFSRYEHAQNLMHAFIEEVGTEFETKIEVCEGEYGKFFTASEARAEPTASDTVRLITLQVSEYLAQKGD